jgi:hypothetical protein
VNCLALCVDCEGRYVAYVLALVGECQLSFIVAGWQLFARDAYQQPLVDFVGDPFRSGYCNEKGARQSGESETNHRAWSLSLTSQLDSGARTVESPRGRRGEGTDQDVGDRTRALYPGLFSQQSKTIMAKQRIRHSP